MCLFCIPPSQLSLFTHNKSNPIFSISALSHLALLSINEHCLVQLGTHYCFFFCPSRHALPSITHSTLHSPCLKCIKIQTRSNKHQLPLFTCILNACFMRTSTYISGTSINSNTTRRTFLQLHYFHTSFVLQIYKTS